MHIMTTTRIVKHCREQEKEAKVAATCLGQNLRDVNELGEVQQPRCDLLCGGSDEVRGEQEAVLHLAFLSVQTTAD